MINFAGRPEPDATIKPFFVMYSGMQDRSASNQAGYWSRENNKWVPIEHATRFTPAEHLSYIRPKNIAQSDLTRDERWLLVAQMGTLSESEAQCLWENQEIKKAA